MKYHHIITRKSKKHYDNLPDNSDISALEYYIANGIPLPKGHGILIDGNALYEKWVNMSSRGRTEFDQVILTAPTVIEADRSEE